MVTPRKIYSSEYKQEAVKLVTEQGLTLSKAARDLDLNLNVLRRWVKESSQHGDKAFPGHGVPIETEFRSKKNWRNCVVRTTCSNGSVRS